MYYGYRYRQLQGPWRVGRRAPHSQWCPHMFPPLEHPLHNSRSPDSHRLGTGLDLYGSGAFATGTTSTMLEITGRPGLPTSYNIYQEEEEEEAEEEEAEKVRSILYLPLSPFSSPRARTYTLFAPKMKVVLFTIIKRHGTV